MKLEKVISSIFSCEPFLSRGKSVTLSLNKIHKNTEGKKMNGTIAII